MLEEKIVQKAVKKQSHHPAAPARTSYLNLFSQMLQMQKEV